jgi:hypothetical protein
MDLLWRLFITTLGTMSMLIGWRSILLGRSMWLVLIAVPGIVAAIFFFKSFLHAREHYMLSFQVPRGTMNRSE